MAMIGCTESHGSNPAHRPTSATASDPRKSSALGELGRKKSRAAETSRASPKGYLLKTEDFSLTPSSVLHPPLPYQHFPALFSYTTIPSGSFPPSTFISLPERAHSMGICQQGNREIIHTYIQS
jgi:hypothetical protein